MPLSMCTARGVKKDILKKRNTNIKKVLKNIKIKQRNKLRKVNSVILTTARCTYQDGDHYSLRDINRGNEYQSLRAVHNFQDEHKLVFVQFHDETNASSRRSV
jgi:hypothetical protein